MFHPTNTAHKEVLKVSHQASCYAVQFNTGCAKELLAALNGLPAMPLERAFGVAVRQLIVQNHVQHNDLCTCMRSL
jgi:hypothetical protein